MTTVAIPQAFVSYFGPDGRPTQEGSIFFTQFSQAVTQAQADIAATTVDVNSLQTQITSNDGDITTLQTRVTDNDTDISSLQTRATAAETQLSSSTVKTYQFEVGTFKKGSTAPTEVTIGSAPEIRGLLFDATNQKASFTFMTPLDAKPGCDFQMMFMCAIAAGKTETVGDLINLRVDYRVNAPANVAATKADSAGSTVTTATTSTTAPFATSTNDNVILTGQNTQYYTYMPHVFLPASSQTPGRVFWGEVSLNSIAAGNVTSIVIYQMHVNYFEKSVADQVA